MLLMLYSTYENVVISKQEVVREIECDSCKTKIKSSDDDAWYHIRINNTWTDGYDNYGEDMYMDLCRECGERFDNIISNSGFHGNFRKSRIINVQN
jgi:hypothetical protein